MIIIDGEKYLIEKELASKHGLSVHWFRRARQKGKTPTYYKLNNKVFYKESEVEEWFKKNMACHK